MSLVNILNKSINTRVVISGNGNIGKLLAISTNVDTLTISRSVKQTQCVSLITPLGKKTRTLKIIKASEINTEINFIIMTTKSYDLLAALNTVKPKLAEKSIIILTQNGLGFHEQILKLFPKCCIILASITYGVKRNSEQTIYSDMRGSIKLGIVSEVQDELTHQKVITKFFQGSELNWEWSDNIYQDILVKFAINCIINPLSLIYNCQNGKLQDTPGFYNIVKELASEIVLVLTNLEISAEELIQQVYKVIAETKHNISSTLADYKQQQRTELEFFNIYLYKLALKNKVAIKTNCAMLGIITQLTK